MTAFTEALKKLAATAGGPFIGILMGFIDTLLLSIYGAADEKAAYFWKIAARTVLDFQPLLEQAAADSSTTLDDRLVEELVQAAHAIVPDYQPAAWPG